MAPRKTKAPQENDAIVKALDFVSYAQADKGKAEILPYQAHSIMRAGTIMAFDGVLAAGTMIDFGGIDACPHTGQLLAAMRRCKNGFSVSAGQSGNVLVKSGAFRVVVPTLGNPADLATSNIYPDAPTVVVDDTVKAAFEKLNPLLVENTPYIVTSTLLVNGPSFFATDKSMVTEYFHGFNLPYCVVPKIAITAVSKCDKSLRHIGFGSQSITFWFEDNSWIRSQLHTEAWPDVARIFDFPVSSLEPIPKKLAEAIEATAPFSDTGLLYLNQDEVASHLDNSIGATHDCKGLPGGVIVAIKRIKDALDFATHVDWTSNEKGVYFQGERVRSLIARR